MGKRDVPLYSVGELVIAKRYVGSKNERDMHFLISRRDYDKSNGKSEWFYEGVFFAIVPSDNSRMNFIAKADGKVINVPESRITRLEDYLKNS